MKKTFAAFVAVATIAGSLAAPPANAQRGVAAGVAAGLIGGAIVGGAIASSRPAYGGPVYVEEAPPRLAVWFASASGTATAGPIAASRSAADLTDRAIIAHRFKTRPMRPGFLFGLTLPMKSWSGPIDHGSLSIRQAPRLLSAQPPSASVQPSTSNSAGGPQLNGTSSKLSARQSP